MQAPNTVGLSPELPPFDHESGKEKIYLSYEKTSGRWKNVWGARLDRREGDEFFPGTWFLWDT